MQGELTGRHVVLGDGIVEQRLEESGALGIGYAPADHAAAEDVENDVEIEVAPFGWPHQLGDIPGPDLVWPFCQQLGLAVGGMAELLAAFADFAVLAEDAVHGADRAMVDAFIEQGGVDLGWRLISEARRVQQIEHHLLLRSSQGPGRCRPWAADRRRLGRPDAPAMHAGTRNSKCGTGRGGRAAVWCECHDRVRQGSSPFGASGMPSSSATFFGVSMMASARFRRSVRRALSR